MRGCLCARRLQNLLSRHLAFLHIVDIGRGREPAGVGGVGEEKGREGCGRDESCPARASHGGARARLGAAGRVRACAGRRRAAVRTRAFRVSRGGASGDVMSGPARRGGSGPVQSGAVVGVIGFAHLSRNPLGDASRRARAAVARCAPWRLEGGDGRAEYLGDDKSHGSMCGGGMRRSRTRARCCTPEV